MRQTDRQTDRQADRQTGRQTDRQTDRQTALNNKNASFNMLLKLRTAMVRSFFVQKYF